MSTSSRSVVALPRHPLDPSNGSDFPPLLVTAEVAGHLLGVGRTTIYELLESGDLPSVYFGRSRRIPVAAIQALIDRRLAQASA